MAVLAALLGGVLATPAAQAAPLPRTTVITWNMQGGTDSVESKWDNAVPRLVADAPVVALQEAGSAPPRSARPIPRSDLPVGVTESEWRAGGTPTYVYFLETRGGRVNVALVTRQRAQRVTVVDNPDPTGQALLGVRFEDDEWYFSYHAQAPTWEPDQGPDGGHLNNDGGRDVQAVLNRVNQQFPAGNWNVAGDFNLEPEHAILPLNQVPGTHPAIYRPNQPTHVLGTGDPRELDYLVAGRTYTGITTQRRNLIGGDHTPVQVGPVMRAGAGPQPPDPAPSPNANDDAVIEPAGDPTFFGWKDYWGAFSDGRNLPQFDTPIAKRDGLTPDPADGRLDELIDRYSKPVTNDPKQPVVYTVTAGESDVLFSGPGTPGQMMGNGMVDAGPALGRMSKLIDTMLRAQPNATVIVATLPPPAPGTSSPIPEQMKKFNDGVVFLALVREQLGQHVTLAPVGDIVKPTDRTSGGTGLTADGNAKVAATFVAAVQHAQDQGWLKPGPGGRSPDAPYHQSAPSDGPKADSPAPPPSGPAPKPGGHGPKAGHHKG